MAISASDVKDLRERTGCGMMDCKKALMDCDGNVEKAVDLLREKGLAKAAKKASRAAKEGRVFSYIHTTGKIGVLLELDCETDFVAKTDEFQSLGHEIAMHVAAAAPLYVSSEDVPSEELEREKEVYRQQALQEGKPQNMLDKIAEGRVRKYYETVCLLEQPWIRDGDKKIGDLVMEAVAKIGENMVVRRFSRFAIGE